MEQDSTPQAPQVSFFNKNTMLIYVAIGVLVLLIVGGGVWIILKSRQNQMTSGVTKTPTPTISTTITTSNPSQTVASSPTQTTTSTPTPVPTLPPKAGFQSYTSSQYGFGFYVQTIQGGNTYSIKEVSSNKVEVYNTKDLQTPVYMQVFQKAQGDTIQQSITKAVLTGYNASDCPITLTNVTGYKNLPQSYQTAQLSYSNPNGSLSKCPTPYAANDSAPYFLVDSNHPTLLFFFYGGQIAIIGGTDSIGNSIAWSDTLTFVR